MGKGGVIKISGARIIWEVSVNYDQTGIIELNLDCLNAPMLRRYVESHIFKRLGNCDKHAILWSSSGKRIFFVGWFKEDESTRKGLVNFIRTRFVQEVFLVTKNWKIISSRVE